MKQGRPKKRRIRAVIELWNTGQVSVRHKKELYQLPLERCVELERDVMRLVDRVRKEIKPVKGRLSL